MKTKKKPASLNKPVRLNKYLADAGVCSRRKADELISSGAVKVNKKIITELGTKVNANDFVTVYGNPVKSRQKFIYILLNKPKNVITTTDDEKGRKTVLDIVRKKDRIFPVGRLDRNTTGALLLTNDGELTNRLTHPRYRIERVYYAKLDKPLVTADAKRISEGVELDDVKTAPCEIFINPKDNTKLSIVLTEGKNKEVHRIFNSFGYNVKQLDRKSYANLTVSGLKKGQYRHLKAEEIKFLIKLTKLEK